MSDFVKQRNNKLLIKFAKNILLCYNKIAKKQTGKIISSVHTRQMSQWDYVGNFK